MCILCILVHIGERCTVGYKFSVSSQVSDWKDMRVTVHKEQEEKAEPRSGHVRETVAYV